MSQHGVRLVRLFELLYFIIAQLDLERRDGLFEVIHFGRADDGGSRVHASGISPPYLVTLQIDGMELSSEERDFIAKETRATFAENAGEWKEIDDGVKLRFAKV